MSGWTALNIEPAEAIEEEVDDTKEIQIEEALKLYQNALKLHSQGSQFYPEAAEAYDALFNSDIFKYPESASEYKRNALPDSDSHLAESAEDQVPAADALADIDINDSTSSTLLQTIYLSYKNHGQYLLDSLQEFLHNLRQTPDDAQDPTTRINSCSSAALSSFADALERDDSDLNLWRKSARLSSALQSFRLTRYCLESVLADDENRLEVRTEQLGLEETLAEERLRETLGSLQDRMSVSQVPFKKPRKALLKFLKRQNDPYPYLPLLPANLEGQNISKSLSKLSSPRYAITPTSATWEAVGKAILQTFVGEHEDGPEVGAGTSINIVLPEHSPEEMLTEPDEHVDQAPVAQDQEHQSIEQNDPSTAEGNDQAAATEPPPVKSEDTDTTLQPEATHSTIDQATENQPMEGLDDESKQQPEPADEGTGNGEMMHQNVPENSGRKRSSASAANDDHAEGVRTKSKRIRARESNADTVVQSDEVAFDHTRYYENRLAPFIYADEALFETVGSLLSKVGVEELGTLGELRQQTTGNSGKDSSSVSERGCTGVMLSRELRNILTHWDDQKSRGMQQGDNISGLNDIRNMSKTGLAAFLEHSKRSTRKLGADNTLPEDGELSSLLKNVNDGRIHLHEVAFCWLRCLLMPDYGKLFSQDHTPSDSDWPIMESAYTSFQWPDALKETVVQLLQQEDEYLYSRMSQQVADLDHRVLRDPKSLPNYDVKHFSGLEMIQAIFELHLDTYAAVNNPNSEVDHASKLVQRDRAARWSMLARTSLTHFVDYGPQECRNNIVLRHLWASTFHLNVTADVQREHLVLCLQDLKRALHSLGNPEIHLLNSTIMPELSTSTIDQEVSKLRSMDFFMKIFSPDSNDPVELIESIEPILEPSSVEYSENGQSEGHGLAHPASQFDEMRSFLDRGDATLRLFLWRRLQDAYAAIDYTPKVVSCHLRSIETIMKELHGASHFEEPAEHRQVTLLRWLKSLDTILGKVTILVLLESRKAYECFDAAHLKSSMSAVALLSRLLHTSALYEDSVRVGQFPASDLRGTLSKSFEGFKEKLRQMQVRCWILQYTLLKETMAQNVDLFDTPSEDRIHYLRAVHNALGIRSMCKYSEKQFLKLMMGELFESETYDNLDFDICQILFDLHGIKLTPFDGVVDHGCPSQILDKATAIMMIDFVLRQANKLSIKDLSKSELKSTIEKMQKAIGAPRSSPQQSYNKRIFAAFLKSPINPTDLVSAVRGVGDLSMIPAPPQNAVIAQKGWYFLLGHAALTKFRSQKRLNAVPTTDLDDAITYFRLDLEHGTGRWESWYRLAQTYDSKLDEDITWAADKMNNNKADLATWQRYAIHCYTMALSAAIKTAEPTPESRALLSDLYSDFGIRMYASSREPLSMGAFSLVDFTRHYNNQESHQMYTGKPFKEAKLYFVWNFASYLLRLAIVDKPKNWMNHYMLGKCYWKMFNCDEYTRGNFKRGSIDDVLDSFLDAIDALPQRRDARSDPIFEPHFKLVSTVHKLVHNGTLTAADGSKTLLATPWARKVQAPEDITGWKSYVLEILKNLKNADKSNWHHRIASRAAHVMYDDQRGVTAAAAAKNDFMHQVFTKTMTIQVWKPEFERPGRHFVFTTRYVYFFISLLDQLDDRASLDQLSRRVRKKQGDFLNHTKLWEDICLTYSKVIRRAGNINEGHEEGVFKPIGWEEFVANTARLENLPQLAPESAFILELLRDAVELKRLNNHLMKVTPLEDLVADIYSRLYQINLAQLTEQVNEENKEKMRVDRLLMAGDTPTPPTSAPTSEAPAPRGRTKGIARKDVQKRAETIVARRAAARPPPTAVTTKPAAEATTQPPAPTSAPEPSSAPNNSPSETPRDAPEEPVSAPQSDIPGSLRESADDESELSELGELDDEKLSKLGADRRQMPNLADGAPGEPGSEMSGHVSFDGGDAEVAGGDENMEEEGAAEGAGDVEGAHEGEDDGNKEGGVGEAADEDETMVEAGEEEAAAKGEGEDEGEGAGEEGADKEGEADIAGAEVEPMEEEGEGEGEGEDEAEGDETETQEGDVHEEPQEADDEEAAGVGDVKDIEGGEDVETEQSEPAAKTDEKENADENEPQSTDTPARPSDT